MLKFPSTQEDLEMPHLAVFRRGWQNEHLAAFILSKFAFVAHPSKIGDDLGTDFFCTFFETISEMGKEYLIPRNSFAIQIKSSGDTIDATTQIEYLLGLELPFFIGIINQEISTLNIYSGEYLPILFSHQKIPVSLTLELCSKHDFPPHAYFEEVKDKAYRLKCPLVATVSVTTPNECLNRETNYLREVTRRIHRNIASRASNEFIFAVGSDGHTTAILAGPGSAEVFRENFKKRLAEVFHNLAWIVDHPCHSPVDADEFRFYEKIYDEMRQREGNLPHYLTTIADELKNKFPTA